MAEGESNPCVIGRGVRQGCPLSPVLFSVYVEMTTIAAMERVEEGVVVGGELFKDVRFAHDQAMVAYSEAGLQRLMDSLSAKCLEYDMKIHVKKTKVMKISRRENDSLNITINGQEVEQVRQFKYLGSLITEDGRSGTEIRARKGMAKEACNNRKYYLPRA